MHSTLNILITLLGLVAAIPIPVSIAVNGGITYAVWTKLRRERTSDHLIRIIKHTILFLWTWAAFSITFGLTYMFDELETTPGVRLVDGFMYGFHYAMAIFPVGLVIIYIPMLLLLRRTPD